MNIQMWWISLFLMQDVQGQADRVRAAMAASIAKQRASIRQQVQAAAATGMTFSWHLPEAVSRTEFPCSPIATPELEKMIGEAATEHKLDPSLVREVAREESGFYPCAVSPKGAVGLMQLMPATQTQFAVHDPLDPRESLGAGAKLLKQLMERYNGDLRRVLSAYNAGAGRVDHSAGVPSIPETQQYVADILGRLMSGLNPATPGKVLNGSGGSNREFGEGIAAIASPDLGLREIPAIPK